MSGEIAFFEIGVEDAERARTFYGTLFGWSFAPGPSGGGGSWITTPTVPGGVHGGDPGASPSLFFRVDDLSAALARVRELGGTVEGTPDEDPADDPTPGTANGRFVLCRDDQGSPFGLFEAPSAAGGEGTAG